MKKLVTLFFAVIALSFSQQAMSQCGDSETKKTHEAAFNNLKTDLELSDEQGTKLMNVFKSNQSKIETANSIENKETRKEKVTAVRESREQEIMLVLTDSQYKEFKGLRLEKRYTFMGYTTTHNCNTVKSKASSGCGS